MLDFYSCQGTEAQLASADSTSTHMISPYPVIGIETDRDYGFGRADTMRAKGRRVAVFLLLVAISNRTIPQQPDTTLAIGVPQPVCVEERAKQALAHGQFTELEKMLRQSLESGQICPDAHFLLAYALLRQNLPKESLAEYTSAARLRTPTPEDLRNVALDYVLLKDYSDAEHWINKSLEFDANNPETWYVLGRVYYSSGKFQDAVNSFEHALILLPGSVKAEDNLGLAYQGLNEIEQAIDAYQRAIDLGDRSGKPSEQPMINLAIVLAHRSDLDGALALLKRAVILAPEDPRVREHLGYVYLHRNELQQAQVQLEKAVSLSPSNSRLHYMLGTTYRREGQKEKADSEFSIVASLNGTRSTPD